MTDFAGNIYIGTILLEPNRWTADKLPSFRVSDWLDRFAAAGFDGMELWENHAARCSPGELAAMDAAQLPVGVYNSYAGFDEPDQQSRLQSAGLAKRLHAQGVKFNLGADAAKRDVYLKNLQSWRGLFDEDCRLLCECHAGTILEQPAAAKEALDAWGPRFEIIVHPIGMAPEALREWMDAFGGRVTHAHMQLRDPQEGWLRLDQRPEQARRMLGALCEGGFAGSWTLEFTQGTGTPGETPELLFENALRDLAFLRENWR